MRSVSGESMVEGLGGRALREGPQTVVLVSLSSNSSRKEEVRLRRAVPASEIVVARTPSSAEARMRPGD